MTATASRAERTWAQAARDYRRVGAAIRFLEANARRHPSLDDVAAHVGSSPHHFQRLFVRWAGVSPKRFLQLLTAASARQRLRESASVLDATYDAGLSSPGRLHDLFVALEAVTPGEWKKGGAGLEIGYGIHPSPFGGCFLAETARGICFLAFTDADGEQRAGEELRKDWPRARIVERAADTRRTVERVFDSRRPPGEDRLPVLVRGTNFQVQVWRALLRVPEGALVSYGALSEGLGRPGSVRAVASAIGRNPVSYLIPCHRVLRKTGALGGYRWGTDRKRAMLAWEGSRLPAV